MAAAHKAGHLPAELLLDHFRRARAHDHLPVHPLLITESPRPSHTARTASPHQPLDQHVPGRANEEMLLGHHQEPHPSRDPKTDPHQPRAVPGHTRRNVHGGSGSCRLTRLLRPSSADGRAAIGTVASRAARPSGQAQNLRRTERTAAPHAPPGCSSWRPALGCAPARTRRRGVALPTPRRNTVFVALDRGNASQDRILRQRQHSLVPDSPPERILYRRGPNSRFFAAS
jgi:hypothetical protein